MKIFVPIKNESMRLPNKNFLMFGDVPLYKYVLDKFKGFDVYVDTDVPEKVVDVEAHVYRRPMSLCGNDVSVNKLISHFLYAHIIAEPIELSEPIVQIHVTSPFIRPGTILHAAEALMHWDEKNDSVVSCTSLQARFWRMEMFDDDEYVPIPVNHDPRILEQTQKLRALMMENSLFYVFTKASFEKFDNRVGASPMFWTTNFPENLDIDTEDDWKMAEALLEAGIAR